LIFLRWIGVLNSEYPVLLAVVVALLILTVVFTLVYIRFRRRQDSGGSATVGGALCFAFGVVVVASLLFGVFIRDHRTEVTAFEYGQLASFLSKNPEARNRVQPYYADGVISVAEWAILRADVLGRYMDRSILREGILRKRAQKAGLSAGLEAERF